MISNIGIIDLGINNIRSLVNLFDTLRVDYELVTNSGLIKKFNKIVLPGVGSFSPAIKRIRDLGFEDELMRSISNGVPILGICLGMQLFFDSSEEGSFHGLGAVKGTVKLINVNKESTLPHIGWNEVCLLYTSPSPRDRTRSRMPSSA